MKLSYVDVRKLVTGAVRNQLCPNKDDKPFTEHTALSDINLGYDSLDCIELVMVIEEDMYDEFRQYNTFQDFEIEDHEAFKYFDEDATVASITDFLVEKFSS